jgi:hypothetical protein
MAKEFKETVESKNIRIGGLFPRSATDQSFAQDAGRSTPVLTGTLIGQIAASGKWITVTDLALTTGEVNVMTIYEGDEIPAADLVAGDVYVGDICIGGDVRFNENYPVTLENSLTLDSVIGASTVWATTIRRHLETRGIYIRPAVPTAGQE